MEEVAGMVIERTGLDDDVVGDEVSDEDVIHEEAFNEMPGVFRA